MTKESWERPDRTEIKKLLQGVGAASIGLGIGSSLGFAADQLILPKLMKQLGPKERVIFAAGVGTVAGLASSALAKKVINRATSGKRR